MVRNLTSLATKSLMRFIGADGKAATHGIKQAVGMFDRCRTPNFYD